MEVLLKYGKYFCLDDDRNDAIKPYHFLTMNSKNINTLPSALHLDRVYLPLHSATSIMSNIISHTPELRVEIYRRERNSVLEKCFLLKDAIELTLSGILNQRAANGVFAVFLPSNIFSTVDSLLIPMSLCEVGFFSNEKRYRYLPEEFLTRGGGINASVALSNNHFADIVGHEAASVFNNLFTDAMAIFKEKGYGPIAAILSDAAQWLTRMADDTDTPLSQSFEHIADELIARIGELK